MGLRSFPGKFLECVWSLVVIRAEMSKQHYQTCLNLSTIQWRCTLSAQCLFLHFRMLLFFSITSYPAEIAYFNSPHRELSNGVQVMELYWYRNVDPSRSPCLETVDRKNATAVPVCMCVTHHLPFIGSGIYLSFGPSCWSCIFKLPRSRAF